MCKSNLAKCQLRGRGPKSPPPQQVTHLEHKNMSLNTYFSEHSDNAKIVKIRQYCIVYV